MAVSNKFKRYAGLFLSAGVLVLLATVQSFGQAAQADAFALPEDENPNTYSHDLKDQTITFQAVNEQTQTVGQVTITLTGTFRGNRVWDGRYAGGSHILSVQHASFTFVPSDASQPSYTANLGKLKLSGDSFGDSILFDSIVKGIGSDGSEQRFALREVVRVTEYGAEVVFEQLKLSNEEASQ